MPNSRSSPRLPKKYGRLILVRHATSNYDPRCVPPPDPPLAPPAKYKHDYQACVAALPRDALWYVSPLARCQATAKLLKQHGGSPREEVVAEWLCEQNYGDWHGKPIADIWQETLHALPRHHWHFLASQTRPPSSKTPNENSAENSGESFMDVIARLTPHAETLRQELQKNHADNTIVLVTHGMVIRAMLAILLNLPPALALGFAIQPLSLTALTTIYDAENSEAESGVWRLDYLNRVY